MMGGRARDLAFSAMAAALGVVLLFLAGILPAGRLALIGVAGLPAALVRFRSGWSFGLGCFAATTLLALLFSSMKSAVVLYAAFLGYYPMVKGSLERLPRIVLRYVVKLALFNAAFAVLLLFASAVLTDALPAGLPLPLLLAGGSAVFLVYDIALTQLILFANRRLAGKSK
jgi:hypothetical protein